MRVGFRSKTRTKRRGNVKHSLRFAQISAVVALVCCALFAQGQAAARFMGSITGISGNTLTVKTDAGDQKQVEVPAEASLKRIEPGQKDLSTAASMVLTDLAVGDRVLVKLDPNATGAVPQASLVVAIKAADVAKKQQQDQADWQKRGVAGLVKSVERRQRRDPGDHRRGAHYQDCYGEDHQGYDAERYAPGSVRFSDAQPAPIDAIHSGDQLRARGNKAADGSSIDAEEVVSGTFRNVAGTINSIDAAAGTLVVKDLTTKKPVTIHFSADAQLHRIPDRMAQMLAARLKGTMPAGGWQQRAANGGGAPTAGGAPGGGAPGGGAPAGGAPGAGGPYAGQGGAGGGDPSRFLSMAPTIKLADLQKGEAVMVVATDGTTDVNAITLLAGVEPLLEAPAATNLLSNWSMGGGGGGGGEAGGPGGQ